MDIKRLPKTEFAAAVAQIAGERNIDVQSIIDSIELGLISAYKRDQKEHGHLIPEEAKFTVELSPETGSFAIFSLDDNGHRTDVTPPGFGRIAAQTAKQVIDQKIHEAEKDTVIKEYEKRIGTLVSGVILKIDPYKITVGIGKTEAVCPKEEQVKNESFVLGVKKLFLVQKISHSDEGRSDIILSRKDNEFIKALFAREVPEVGNHAVIIEKIARSPGERTKVAVASNQPGVDPVGSCIGKNGSRIQAVLAEISQDEKLDVIAFSNNRIQYIINALSPAQDVKVVSADKGIATVTVPENQLALAIGAGGENVRLAGILTGLEIKVQSENKP